MGGIEAEIGEREGFSATLSGDIFDPIKARIVAAIGKVFGGALDAVVGKGCAAEVGFDRLKIGKRSRRCEAVRNRQCAGDISEIGAAQRFEVGGGAGNIRVGVSTGGIKRDALGCIKGGKEGLNCIKSGRACEGALRKVIITSGIGGAAEIGGWSGVAWCAISDNSIAIKISAGLFF